MRDATESDRIFYTAAAARMWREMQHPSFFIGRLPPAKPLTRTQRLKRRLVDAKDRIKGAWDVLRGKAQADYEY